MSTNISFHLHCTATSVFRAVLRLTLVAFLSADLCDIFASTGSLVLAGVTMSLIFQTLNTEVILSPILLLHRIVDLYLVFYLVDSSMYIVGDWSSPSG
ncbi:hypothetical protein V1523DRAFT_419780 [Lipomyces doorenjongii]